MPGGTARTAAAATVTSSAKAPTITVPATRSPTASPTIPSATSVTSPANSLPGTNGGATVTWYLSATSSTSGKLTAAARTATRTWPAARSGSGISSTSTTSGPP